MVDFVVEARSIRIGIDDSIFEEPKFVWFAQFAVRRIIASAGLRHPAKCPRCWNRFCGSKKAPALGRRAGPSGMYELPACPVMIVRYHNEQTVNDRYPRCRAGEMVGRWGTCTAAAGPRAATRAMRYAAGPRFRAKPRARNSPCFSEIIRLCGAVKQRDMAAAIRSFHLYPVQTVRLPSPPAWLP